jgi:hypothetical protein
VASVSHSAPIHLGLDVHRDTISVGILGPGEQVPAVDKLELPDDTFSCASTKRPVVDDVAGCWVIDDGAVVANDQSMHRARCNRLVHQARRPAGHKHDLDAGLTYAT